MRALLLAGLIAAAAAGPALAERIECSFKRACAAGESCPRKDYKVTINAEGDRAALFIDEKVIGMKRDAQLYLQLFVDEGAGPGRQVVVIHRNGDAALSIFGGLEADRLVAAHYVGRCSGAGE